MSDETAGNETEAAQEEASGGQTTGQRRTATEEIKVQTEDLFRAINDLIREGSVRRVTVLRNDRVLVDIPLIAGLPLSLIMATQMPFFTAVLGVGALVGGCTLRIERDEPAEEE